MEAQAKKKRWPDKGDAYGVAAEITFNHHIW